MGASPDGIVNCEGCGNGVVETKCPYSCTDKSFLEPCDGQSFCLERCSDTYKLKKDHLYYYQIQAQMEICRSTYGNFVVWHEYELIVKEYMLTQHSLNV